MEFLENIEIIFKKRELMIVRSQWIMYESFKTMELFYDRLNTCYYKYSQAHKISNAKGKNQM